MTNATTQQQAGAHSLTENEAVRLVESILRAGERADLSNWRVIDIEQDARRRLGETVERLGGGSPPRKHHKHKPDDFSEFKKKHHAKRHTKEGHKVRAARIVHGDGTYKLCHFSRRHVRQTHLCKSAVVSVPEITGL